MLTSLSSFVICLNYIADHKASIEKLTDLREAWVKYVRPAVSRKVEKLLQQHSAGLTIPDIALDLTALQHVIDKCTPDDNSPPSTPTASPLVTLTRISEDKIEQSRLDTCLLYTSPSPRD